MARTIGSNGTRTAEAIRQAGVKLIYRHGYEAMSLRQLAAEVGLQSGSLYKYFENKQNLLFDIVREHMQDLLAKAEADLAGVEAPLARLKAFTAFHLRYHMTRMAHVFIANMEIRSLEEEHRAVIIAQRHRYEGLLEETLRRGAEAGVFQVSEPKVATYAIISMLTGICMWYRPEGRLSQDDIVETYTGLVVGGVTGAQGALAAASLQAAPAGESARGALAGATPDTAGIAAAPDRTAPAKSTAKARKSAAKDTANGAPRPAARAQG
ncbi:TetR/AcrR family transcriptional regulator [Xanthobacter sp. V2C-8]|uniref:TetR/AcrR family transcriptional regulator n=1 Tax=Xanthobacter albus TaxID=3119929 RepID=UPI0037289CAE